MRCNMYFLIIIIFNIGLPSAVSQIPDGTFAQNFKGVDTNGDEYELFQLLEDGYKVVIDISTTWCEPCWDYHITDALKDLHTTYGPDGTQEVFVLFIESDDTNSIEDLMGLGDFAYGDWLSGTPYPVIDNGNYIASQFSITYLPTIFTICGDGRVYETGTMTAQEHYDFAMAIDCQHKTFDLAIQQSQTIDRHCTAPIDAKLSLINVGDDAIISAAITMDGCETCPRIQNWNGFLNHFEQVDIVFEEVNVVDDTLSFIVTSIDSFSDSNLENNHILSNIDISHVAASTTWYIQFITDCYPYENQWRLRDSDGEIVDWRNDFTEPLSVYMDTLVVDNNDCYTMEFLDYNGNGLNGSSAGGCGVDGFFRMWSDDGIIMDVGGAEQFSDISQNILVSQLLAIDQLKDKLEASIYPNPSHKNLSIEINGFNGSSIAIVILNTEGKEMRRDMLVASHNSQKFQLDISELPNGFYFVDIMSKELRITKRFVKTE